MCHETDMVNMLGTLITHTHGVLEECKEGSHVRTTKKNPKTNKQTKTSGAKGT